MRKTTLYIIYIYVTTQIAYLFNVLNINKLLTHFISHKRPKGILSELKTPIYPVQTTRGSFIGTHTAFTPQLTDNQLLTANFLTTQAQLTNNQLVALSHFIVYPIQEFASLLHEFRNSGNKGTCPLDKY
jgi:hypothetical protein